MLWIVIQNGFRSEAQEDCQEEGRQGRPPPGWQILQARQGACPFLKNPFIFSFLFFFIVSQYRRWSQQQTWRKPKGIDNRVRRRFSGTIRQPTIGYGSDKKTKFLRPDGFKTFLVHNPSDLSTLLMHNRTVAAEIAHNVSSRKRINIIKRAIQLNIKVTNAGARVKKQEKK